MKIINANKYGKINIQQLTELEQYLGVELPLDYREFLIQFNGGKPIPNTYDLVHNNSSSIHHIYGIHHNKDYNLQHILESYAGRISSDVMPIFDDSFGNEICIGIKKHNYGYIFFWEHDASSCTNKLIKITDSFSDFLDSLYEYIDNNETEIIKSLKEKNLDAITKILDSGYDFEALDKYNRSLLENATIYAFNDLIFLLYQRGAKLRKSIILAKENDKFFDGYKKTIDLLTELFDKSE